MAVTIETEVDTLIHYRQSINTYAGLHGENAAAFVMYRFRDAERELAARRNNQLPGASLIRIAASVLSGRGISGAQKSEPTVEQIAETKLRELLTIGAERAGKSDTLKLPPRKFAL